MRKRKFVKFYNDYHSPIQRFIYFRVNAREVAEDLTTEVFLKCFNYFKKIKPENPRAVLYKIARNLVIDYYRKNRDIRLEQETQAEDKHFTDLHKALDKLKDEQKEVVVLFYFEGFKHQEIAQIIGKKEIAVRSILHRAKRQLKQHL